jgi:hypothetical protein
MNQAAAYQGSGGILGYYYQDDDAIKSLKRYLARALAPETADFGSVKGSAPNPGNPYIYDKPTPEGQFKRPAITLRLIDTSEDTTRPRRASNASYSLVLTIAMQVYGQGSDPTSDFGRLSTMALSERVRRVLDGDDPRYPAWRIPMWNFQANVKLARLMRVMPGSPAMGLSDTDDLGKWYRGMTLRLQVPRLRLSAHSPVLQSFNYSFDSKAGASA